jgi:hypothetical protein
MFGFNKRKGLGSLTSIIEAGEVVTESFRVYSTLSLDYSLILTMIMKNEGLPHEFLLFLLDLIDDFIFLDFHFVNF